MNKNDSNRLEHGLEVEAGMGWFPIAIQLLGLTVLHLIVGGAIVAALAWIIL
jgi:hypothetical protein